MGKTDKELAAAEILKADDLRTKRVDIPEWDGHVYVRTMTAAERDQYEASIWKFEDGKRSELSFELMRAKFVALTACNAKGKRIFDWNQVRELGKKSWTAMSRVYEAALMLNAMSSRDIEDMIEDFKDGQGVDLSSD